mgnify:CR=1 FL=1
MNEVLIILGLILLNGVFSMSEIALISARKSRLTTDIKKGNKGAQSALKLASQPDRFLSTVQIGITLIGILTGIYSGRTLAVTFADMLLDWGIKASIAPSLAQGVIVVIVTYLTLIFGELLPKRIGMAAPENISKGVARPMYIISLITSPFVWLLSKSTSLIFKLLNINESSSKITEEEIKSIIQEGTDEGEVQPMEQDIMERVFALGDMRINSIMTHRNEVVWFDSQMTIAQAKQVMNEDIYELYPVANGDLDHVKGVVSLKDLVLHMDQPHLKLEHIITPITYFHEGLTVYKALEQMKQQNISRALVFDEWGSCKGIITLKDIFEGLVGDVMEADEEPMIIKRKEKEGWLVDGQCPIYDFLEHFEREDLYEATDYLTLAGLILKDLQHIPQSGESISWNGFHLEVVDMDGSRIDKVLVTLSSHK